MTLPVPGGDTFAADVARVLGDLAGLVCKGVPGCDGASVSLLRQGSPSTVAATSDRVRGLDEAQYERDSGPCVTAMREGREVTVADFDGERRWPEVDEQVRAAGVRSSLSLPLTGDGQVLGGLNLYADQPASFGAVSVAAAEAFARQAVLMLGYLQQLHAERAARDRERQVSAQVQRSLLPSLPEIPGVRCAARYQVGSEHAQVGGDWYDLFALPDGAVGIAVGDVMGHDLAAATAMGQLRSVLRSYAYEGHSPSVVLDRLDRLVQDFEMAQLATAIYGRLVIDTDAGGAGSGSGMLLFTNAGHPPPLLRLPDGRTLVLRRGAAPLIGALPPGHTRRGEGAVALPAGSLLVLYTDGLVERRDRDLDDGIDILAGALTDLDRQATPEQVCEHLLDVMAQPGQDDDIAVLALRLEPEGGQPGRDDARAGAGGR